MATKVGAFSTHDKHWHQIDWQRCYKNGARLQARIVKATQEGKKGKVRSLQWLLIHSFSAKALAVRRVTENRGKNTPGIDGQRWSTPQAKIQAISQLQRRGYRPQPARRVYIPKANGKRRPLGIMTMKDRAMQALYLQCLDPIAETRADPTSYGFRLGRSTADAIERCFKVLAKRCGAQWILEGDIESCFDQISHPWLLDHIPMDRRLLEQWLKRATWSPRCTSPPKQEARKGGSFPPCSPTWHSMG